MFREIKNIQKKLTDDEMNEILERAEYGVLSTIGEDGYPYGVPVNFVYDDGNILFHCGKEGHKLDNILFNNKVSFCVTVDVELIPREYNTRYKSVIAFGTIEQASEEENPKILMKIIEKFSKDFLEVGAKYVEKAGHKANTYKIKVEYITAKGKK